MKTCQQCGRRATTGIESRETGEVLWLCIDCNLKWEQAETLHFARVASAANRSAASLERSLGIPVPRYDVPRVPIPTGPVTTNNISIGGDLMGVLNTGSIESVDNSVTAIRNAGEEELAARLTAFVEAVAKSGELTDERKREVVELVSLVSSEATAPQGQRRSSAMLAVLANIAAIVGAAASVAGQWAQLQPMLARVFEG